jgi:hypothetical protein
VNIAECKKPREKGRRIPAKDPSTPRARLALPQGNGRRASGSRGGSREKEVVSAWKRGSQSLSRREDGVSVFEPSHHGKAPVDVAFGRHSGPPSRRSHRRAGDRSRRASRGAPFANHHEWWGRACWTAVVSTTHGPPGEVELEGRKAQRGKRIQRFVEVPRVPNCIRRLLIEWRSILPDLAVHPAGEGQQGRVLDVDSVRDHPRPRGKGVGLHVSFGARGLHSRRFRANRAEVNDEGQTGFRVPASRVRAISVARIRVAQSIACAESSLSQV